MIAEIRAILEGPREQADPGPRPVVLGIGDDAAVWQPSRSHRSVISTDMLVAGVHFHVDRMRPEDIGARAMAANLSDLAAMGARPVLATVGLGLPRDLPNGSAFVGALYRGLHAVARTHGLRIVGGDIVRAPALTLALTVIGEVSASHLKLRSGGVAATCWQ